MNENDDLTILIQAALDFEKSLQTLTTQMNQMRQIFSDYQIKVTASLDKTASRAQINSGLKSIKTSGVKTTAQLDKAETRKKINSSLKDLKTSQVKIKGVLDSAATYKNLKTQFEQIPNVEAKASVKTEGVEDVDALSQKMDKASTSASGIASKVYLARTALQALRQAAREAADTVVELDKAATDLAIATGSGSDEVYDLLSQYNEMAKDLAATTTQVAQAADEWLRQGRSISDTTTLIEDSMVLSKVSQLDSASATEYLTAAMKGYKISVQDVIGVVDKLAAVDLVSATDAGELAEAMSRTAVTADMAGVSMDRLLGYLATVGETTQKSMSSVGEGFKTIFTRMSDIKENKLQLVDEEGTTELLSDVELTLKNVGIDLRATINEYNNYGDVLDSLAAKWDTLSEVQQNALTKAFAGTRQGENFRVLMENYSAAVEYMNVAADSAGTALEKFSSYEDSIEARAASFTAALESLTMSTVDPDFVKDLINAGTAVVDFVEKTGLLKSALVSFGAGATLKGVEKMGAVFNDVSHNVISLGESINVLRQVEDVSNLTGDAIAKLGLLTKGLSNEQLKLVLTSQQLSSAQMQAILTASGLTAEEAAQKIQTLGLATSEATATGATWSLSAAMTGLGASIKSAFASNPVGMTMLAVSSVYTIISSITSLLDAAISDAEQLTEEYQEQLNVLESLNSEQEENAERIKELNELKTSGEITLVQEEELKRLQRQNDLLEAQITMYEELNKSKQTEINDKAVEQAKQFFSGERATEDAWGVVVGEDSGIVKLEQAMAAYKRIQKMIEEETVKGKDADQEALANLEANKRSQLEILTELSDEMQNYAASIDAADPANQELVDMLDLNINKVTLLVGGTQAFETVWNRLWGSDSPVEGVKEAAEQLTNAADAQAKWNAELKKYGSNVDLTNRKILKGSDLAGNDLFDGVGADDNVTLYSQTFTAADFGGKGTQAILVTPILPDGTVFESQKDLEDYIASLLKADGSGFDLSKDTKGITLGVFDEGDIDASIEKAGQIAVAAHEANQAFDELYQSGTVQKVISLLEEMGVDISEISMGEFAAMFENAAEAANKSSQEIQSLAGSIKTLQTAYDTLKSAQEEFASSGGFTADTLSSIIEKFPDMAENVDLYLAGLKSGKELLKDLSDAYDTDYQNYLKSVRQKLAASPEFYNSLSADQKKLINDLANSYEIDLSNFKDLESKKLAFQAEIISKLASNYSRYTGATIGQLQTALNNLDDQWIISADPKVKAERNAVKETLDALKKMQDAVDSIVLDTDPWTPSKYSSSSSSKSKTEEYIADIEKYRDAQKRLNDIQEDAARIQEKMDNSQNVREQIILQKQLISVYGQEQEALTALNKLRDQTISEGVEKLRGLGFAVQYNAEADELWISNMEHLNQLTAASKGKYSTLQEATNALRKDTEELIDSITELNDANKEGVSSWNELGYSIRDAKENVYELLNMIVQNASDAVDSIQDVYDTLHSAADKYAESGYVTIDTLQSVRAMGQKYLAYLVDESGQLVINEERIRAVIAAKTQDLAVESSLSYIEALRIAKQEGNIETLNNLLYATEEATDATWGFVYANLALVGLDEDQYQAALHNINALRALADSACKSIGQTAGSVTDTLNDMKSGLDDILDYVMDMLKQRINDQIDALEDMKDVYSEIIAEKKASLEASQKEASYQKTMASKLKQIAALQAKIDMLSLDGSREAQAEKASLMEELAELQDYLNDTQSDHAVEAQEDALDKMEDAYHEEKDKEIKVLQDSISSTQKLYDMAIDYIGEHWDTLYGELIDWNTEYGNNLNSEITSAWENCLAAAQRYGCYVSALNSIDTDIEASAGSNLTVGNTNYDNSSTNDEKIHAIIKEMYSNMKEHGGASSSTSPERKAYLSQRNLQLGEMLRQYGVMAYRSTDKSDYGTWYTDTAKSELLFDKYRKYIYHDGGIIGGGDVKSNEQISLLKDREWVLSETMVQNLTAQMDQISQLSKAFSNMPSSVSMTARAAGLRMLDGNAAGQVTDNRRSIEITFGDTVIHGADQKTVQKHIEVNRDMVNQIAKVLGIRR